MGARCFLTPAAKTAHKPTQVGQRGDLTLPVVDLPNIFFFWAHPQSPFLCLCGAVFAQSDPPIEYSNNVLQNVIRVLWKPFFVFCAAIECASLKLPQNWPKSALLWVWVLFPYLDRESLTQAHTAGHAGRSCLDFVPDAFFLCTSGDTFSNCCW